MNKLKANLQTLKINMKFKFYKATIVEQVDNLKKKNSLDLASASVLNPLLPRHNTASIWDNQG